MIARQIQREVHTAFDRYPDLFRAAQALSGILTGGRRLKLLSFGCSRGEEVLTLRRYFPDAELFGCDVNEEMLAVAQRNAGRVATIFRSDEESARRHGPFDVIVALSVLCVYGRDEKSIAKAFPFRVFEDTVGFLHSCLSETGLLAIYNASYAVSDTSVANQLTPILHPAIIENSFVTRYDTASRMVARRDENVTGSYEIVGRPAGLVDHAFTDVFFRKAAAEGAERLVYLQEPGPDCVRELLCGVQHDDAPPMRSATALPVRTEISHHHSGTGTEYRLTRRSRPSVERRGLYRHPPLVEIGEGDGFVHAPGTLFRTRRDVVRPLLVLNGPDDPSP